MTEKKKIVIADDEASIRRLVSGILGKDYDVLEASNGEEALEIVRIQRPDLVLMDVMMPKLDGIGACWIMKSDSVTKEIPVIMVTALGHPLDRDYAKDMGADAYFIIAVPKKKP